MKLEHTKLQGCYLIHDSIYKDERGYFFESYNELAFKKNTGLNVNFVQDNQSHSCKGVLRGLHFQVGQYSQAKLVRVLKGTVLDVAVDIRPNSSTYGQYLSVELSESSGTQLFIPRGFAHGFVVLSDTADFFYKCDNYYNKNFEGGILYNDPAINIDWQLKMEDLIVSNKDKQLPLLENLKGSNSFEVL